MSRDGQPHVFTPGHTHTQAHTPYQYACADCVFFFLCLPLCFAAVLAMPQPWSCSRESEALGMLLSL